MVAKISAENSFGQVLICLRMSKLNFILKETPYSAYVTIRKKFVKAIEGDSIDIENISIERENIRNVNAEKLQQKMNDLSSKYGWLEYQKEEIEVKNEVLEKEKVDSDDKIEELYARIRELLKSNEKLSSDVTEWKLEIREAK